MPQTKLVSRSIHIRWPLRLAVTLLAAVSIATGANAQDNVVANGGETIVRYGASHALIVGVSKYTAGWPRLDSIPSEVARVERVLKGVGFQVTRHMDPSGDELKAIVEDFIGRYGLDPDNRLLLFFAGHGYSRDNGSKGYVVPVDAPRPDVDETAFVRKALSMTRILSFAREMEAKHALFLFDSCFSGTIFKTRALPEVPPHITRLTAQPVRQFITAGSAGEEVPAKSVFTPAFADAIEYGQADFDKDGYVTGTELGMFIQSTVPRFVQQTPQFGKIMDYDLSRGDFVFNVGKQAAAVASPAPTSDRALAAVGHLQVDVDTPGTVLFVNDAQVGVFSPGTPYTAFDTPVGDLTVRAVYPDGRASTRTATIRRNQHTQIQLTPPARVASTAPISRPLSIALLRSDTSKACFYPIGRDLDKAVSGYAQKTGKGTLTYSYLRGGAWSDDVPRLSELWVGNVIKRKPNATVVARTARKLGVDAVVMAWYHCQDRQHISGDQYRVDVYLIDAKTGKIFAQASDRQLRVRGITEDLMRRYFESKANARG